MIRPSRIETNSPRRLSLYRPWLEALEGALPPGETLLGVLTADALLSQSPLEMPAFAENDQVLVLGLELQDGTERREAEDEPGSRRLNQGFENSTPATLESEYVATWPEFTAMWPRTSTTPTAYVRPGSVVSNEYLATWPVVSTLVSGGATTRHSSFPNSGLGTSVRETPFRRLPGDETEFPGAAFPNRSSGTGDGEAAVGDRYGSLPFYFEQNVGQAGEGLDFVARGAGYTLGVSATEAVMALQNSEFRIQNSESIGFSEPRPLGSGVALEPLADARGSDEEVGCVKSSQTHRDGEGTVRPRGLDAPYEENCSPGTDHSALSTQQSLVRMQLVRHNPAGRAAGVNPLETKINYFLGNDAAQWHTNIPTFAKVQYDDVYPGIDLVYYGTECSGQRSAISGQQCLEYDFVVAPGADPNQIQLNFAGADSVKIDTNGDLVLSVPTDNRQLTTDNFELRQQKPYIYQEVNGTRQEVSGRFGLSTQDSSLVTFDLGKFDRSRSLVIDPLVLGYSTYLGGGAAFDGGIGYDVTYDIAVDNVGHAYVVGQTGSHKFPVTDGTFDKTYNGTGDVFVAKFNEDGSGLIYATYLGGVRSDQGRGIAVDAEGNAYVTGGSWSVDFPTTAGAFDETYNGLGNAADWFVTKLNAEGTNLIFSTFVGGRKSDIAVDIAVDAAGSAYVLGGTSSNTFPVTPGAFDTSYNGAGDSSVAKLSADGSALVYATYLGGSAPESAGAIAVNASGRVFVTGQTVSADFPSTVEAFDGSYNGGGDIYVTQLALAGDALLYSTFLGGDVGDVGDAIALDADDNAYVAGGTGSSNFPVTPGAYDTVHFITDGPDGFVTKLNSTGSALSFSTFLSAGSEAVYGIVVDSAGNSYVTGITAGNLPTTPDAFDKTYNGISDALLMKLNPSGNALVYSTYLGGSHNDTAWGLAMDSAGSAYIAGQTDSADFPTTPSAFKRRNRAGNISAFIIKFVET